MNLFHAELFNFLQQSAKKHLISEGIDAASDNEFLQLEKVLKPTSADVQVPLSEILESYENILVDKRSFPVEGKLIGSFSEREFKKLDLAYPKMCRGLPRIYRKGRPSESHIKKSFSHLPTLRRAFIEKALYSLYDQILIDSSVKITLFTWVIRDGLGDYMAALEAADILRKRFPRLKVAIVALVSIDAKVAEDVPVHLIRYDKKCPLSLIPPEALQEMLSSDLILQMPTFYPETAELIHLLQNMKGRSPCPKMEILGEYGFIESSWFHPRTENRSMGLHFLEKGVMIREKKKKTLFDLKDEKLKMLLFEGNAEGYLATHRLYLAYLATKMGGAVYLHALLKSKENDPLPIDICTPDIKWFVEFVDGQNSQGLPVLAFEANVGSIEVHFQDQIYSVTAGKGTKKVRLICPGTLNSADFQTLLSASEEFVGVRGNQSFSEAVSQEKVFFYDGREHSRYFLKDLLALAENRLSSYPKALVCLRGMGKAFYSHMPQDEGEWVDETAFQERSDWVEIALEIGRALQDGEAIRGCKRLSKIIREEYSCNDFLCHILQRALCHRKWPEIEELEKERLSSFLLGSISFPSLVQDMKSAILRKTP